MALRMIVTQADVFDNTTGCQPDESDSCRSAFVATGTALTTVLSLLTRLVILWAGLVALTKIGLIPRRVPRARLVGGLALWPGVTPCPKRGSDLLMISSSSFWW